MSTDAYSVSEETQIALLLCCVFGEESRDRVKPLSPGEYNRLLPWLSGLGFSPAQIQQQEVRAQLPPSVLVGITDLRLDTLLSRHSELTAGLEKWRESDIWVLGQTDAAYPQRLIARLGKATPPLLFGVGEQALLDCGGLSMVGSRDADEMALEFTRKIASACAHENIQIVSGGARGIDREAMLSGLDASGCAVGVLADSLGREAFADRYRTPLEQGRLTLVTPFRPDAGFSIGNAMGRNKYIYALADWSLVVSAAVAEGGTWAGAVENLKHNWTPLFARDGADVPAGNEQLLEMGALSFTYDSEDRASTLRETLESAKFRKRSCRPVQTNLFASPDDADEC
jgi:predicted Rossmann fold nucleotide-binding protein DprA/Smf involved in DNA uptake